MGQSVSNSTVVLNCIPAAFLCALDGSPNFLLVLFNKHRQKPYPTHPWLECHRHKVSCDLRLAYEHKQLLPLVGKPWLLPDAVHRPSWGAYCTFAAIGGGPDRTFETTWVRPGALPIMGHAILTSPKTSPTRTANNE